MTAMSVDPLVRDIGRGLERAGALSPMSTFLAAVSGGADSIALLQALACLRERHGFQLHAAHFHHGLRGPDADADSAFVRRLASELNVPFHPGRGDVRAAAKRLGLSIETAARQLRYDFLHQVATGIQHGAPPPPSAVAILTAHHADDQAETVLMRLARGAGSRGLGGIRPQSAWQGTPILRPMLGLRRTAIERFLQRQGLVWREDATNAENDFLRNRVRHDVLPMLQQTLNPALPEALCRLADIQAAENDWLDALSADIYPGCLSRNPQTPQALDLAALRALPCAARRRVLRLWLLAQAVPEALINFATIEALGQMIESPAGRRLVLPGPWCAARRHGRLDLIAAPAPTHARTAAFRHPIRMAGETLLPELGLRVIAQPGTAILRSPPQGVGRLPDAVSLARKAIGRKHLVLRSWRPGDRIRPLGMQGSRKLQDIFTDAGLAAEHRADVPVVVCGDTIVWLPGYRIARGWEVTTENDPILELRLERI